MFFLKVNLRSTDVFPLLVRRGLYKQDYRNGLYFRQFLKKLYKLNMLRSLIPQCRYVPGINGEIFGEWYFNIHKLEEVKSIKEDDIEDSIVSNAINSLSYEDAKENLWQLIQGINPLSGKQLHELEDQSLILISKSLKLFIEFEETTEKNIIPEVIKEMEKGESISPIISKSTQVPKDKTSHKNHIEEIRKRYPNAYNPWKDQEESLLINLYKENYKIAEIAIKLRRQPGAIRARLKKNGLID